MKNIYDASTTHEIIRRIDQLESDTKPQWGQMNAAQMLAHCSVFQDIASGDETPERSKLGRLVGRFAKPVFYNDKPLPKNMSTVPGMLITEEKSFDTEKDRLKEKTLTFQQKGPEKCTRHPHPFFGRLTPQQWGKGIYKHLDHHLRQFGV
ncbi:DUF1569 domain-containing protein [Salinicoccus hispanicus]|uniref:DUF1569 domain-containing protein n=1 Tax=Salinicoccus hispanicus TaxID=157225 RepID=A0A6N8U1N4_9STAP|nr:DUF1569 domain-containing protein [Salinicoccus hispanicus]MXQ51990.1 DUF1569 domain-containing protein [Salinicoccus hispanicus]